MWHAIAIVAVISTQDAEPVRITVPLEAGVLDVATLLAKIVDEPGAATAFEGLAWRIDFNDETARDRLRGFDRLAGDACDVELTRERLTLELDPETLAKVQRRLASSADGWLGTAREMWSGGEAVYGVTLVTGDDLRAALPAALPARLVVLVHGLDDPGWIWDDLAPALVANGHAVGRFEYRDDGPIVESADALAISLADLKRRGVERVDLVGHSLGGLVCREVLARPAYYDGDGAARGVLPAVDRLIMLGTPNQGAPIARLHQVGELRQQIVQALRGREPRKGPLGDGRGEVVADLLPGSDFLRRLNGRGLPDHTRVTIVAARLIPVDRADLDEAADATARLLGGSERFWSTVGRLVDGLGDGIVTLDSARLDGVDDFVVVEANHMTMIHTVRAASTRVPPAIPIVIERLTPAR